MARAPMNKRTIYFIGQPTQPIYVPVDEWGRPLLMDEEITILVAKACAKTSAVITNVGVELRDKSEPKRRVNAQTR